MNSGGTTEHSVDIKASERVGDNGVTSDCHDEIVLNACTETSHRLPLICKISVC